MSRPYASVGLAFLIAAVPLFTGLIIAMVMAIPLPDLPQNSATRENAGATKAQIAARLKKIVEQHQALGNKANEFQEQVSAAAQLLREGEKGMTLEFTVPPFGNQQAMNQFNTQLAQIQMNCGLTQFKLDTMLEELDALNDQRAKQSRLWQANHDYVRARLAAQIAFVYEYNAQLGQMRKGVLPLDANKHTGWHLVPQATMTDRDAGKYAQRAKAWLNSLVKDHAGGEWERIAQEEIPGAEAGLKWVQTAK